MRKQILLIAALLLVASAVFIGLAYCLPSIEPSPKQPSSSFACVYTQESLNGTQPFNETTAEACANQRLAYDLFFVYQSWFQAGFRDFSIGSAFLAAVLVVSDLVTPLLPERRILLPRIVKDIFLVGAMSGIVVFAVFAFMDIVGEPVSSPSTVFIGPFIFRSLFASNVVFYRHYFEHGIYYSLNLFGGAGICTLGAAILCMFLYHVEDGVTTAFRNAITLFAAPVLVVFEVALLLFTPVNMPLPIARFLLRSLVSGILTNWFVLAVSSGFLIVGLVYRR